MRLLFFYPRPPYGGRLASVPAQKCSALLFYPRPPYGGRPLYRNGSGSFSRFSIHALRTEGDGRLCPRPSLPRFSIHALRTEGDRPAPPSPARALPFSIHALRTEGDQGGTRSVAEHEGFLSTPSVRRATALSFMFSNAWLFFYPRPPYGGRLTGAITIDSDTHFLSTPSVRRATCSAILFSSFRLFSIHALRTEGDRRPNDHINQWGTFSIHALRTEGDATLLAI